MSARPRRWRRPLLVVAILAAACSSDEPVAEPGPITTAPTTVPSTAPPSTAVSTTEATITVPSAEEVLVDEFAARFAAAGVDGTFIVRRSSDARTLTHDPERAAEARLPASTFKVMNSLIILEAGVVADVDETVPWDGVTRRLSEWNRDHSLRTGIEVSALWMYQELARQVGLEAMAAALAESGYGNADVGGGVDRFWLDGGLRISPEEQVVMLERLLADDLPFEARHQAAVREILVRETGDGWIWAHKTGWAVAPEPELGWLVGWTEFDGDEHVFALNVDLVSGVDPAVRLDLARELLVLAGALPD